MSDVQPDPADRTTTLADGRRVCWRAFGDPQGFPVFALHGTPGSRLKFAGGDVVARKLGIRLISVDRWGYGGTDLHARPSLAAFGDDIGELGDRLALVRFGVLGISGGGPFAAAAGVRLGQRVAALALIAPVGPMHAMRPLRDIGLFHWTCFRVLPFVPGAVALPFAGLRVLLRVAPELAVRLAAARAGAADRAIISDGGVRAGLAQTFATGLDRGTAGAVLDMRLFARAWDVSPGAVQAPARVWLGTADRNVPLKPALMLAQAMPKAECTMLKGEGHYWLSQYHDEVLVWLARFA